MSETYADDVWLAAWLLSRGAHLGEPIYERGQVVFRVVGERVEEDAGLFLRGQAVANVHALKSAMNLARDFIAATKRGNGAIRPAGRAHGNGSESGRGNDGGSGRRTSQA